MLMKREIKEREKGKKGDLGGRTEGGSMMEEGKFMVLAYVDRTLQKYSRLDVLISFKGFNRHLNNIFEEFK